MGWQVQPNGPSVQARLQQALQSSLGEPVSIVAAGRTDSGVHAQGAGGRLRRAARSCPLKAYWMGLNGLLPEDIAVVTRRGGGRRTSTPGAGRSGKRYRYLISNRRTRSPLRRRTHWEIFQPLDVAGDAARAAQAPARAGTTSRPSAPRTARRAHARARAARGEVEGAAGDELAFTVEGTAFLKHMVRNLVGTLVEVGRGSEPAAWVKAVLEGAGSARRRAHRAGARPVPRRGVLRRRSARG